MRYMTKELAARVGLSVDRVRDWLDAGHLTPLNPNRRRVQGHGEHFVFGRRASFACAMGRLADDAGLGFASVRKIVRFCDRADRQKHFADGKNLLSANKGSVQLGHKDAAVFGRGPIQLCVFDLRDLWEKFDAQMNKLETEEAAESAPVGGRLREMLLVEVGYARI